MEIMERLIPEGSCSSIGGNMSPQEPQEQDVIEQGYQNSSRLAQRILICGGNDSIMIV